MYDEVELLPVLNEVESILDNNIFDDCILGGDLNFDQRRGSGFVATLDNFLKRIGLKSAWEKFPIDYTHLHTDLKSSSILDHFFVSQKLLDLIEDAGPVHLGDNRSRHSPIVMKLNIENLHSEYPKQVEQVSICKPAWYKATEQDKHEYTALLSQKLTYLEAPDSLSCSDVNCQHEGHTGERDSHVLDLMCAILEASSACIPLSGKFKSPRKNKRENLPGWRENVAPAKEDALFWHGIWLSAGFPPSGDLYHIMCQSRNQFHYAVRRAKRLAGEIKARKLLEAAEDGNIALMKEMRNTLERKNGGQAVS